MKIFLTRQCAHKIMPISLFSHKDFYRRDKKDIYYIDSVSPKLSQRVIRVFHSISRMKTFNFPTGVLNDYIRVHSSYFSHRVFRGV
jgi:hypothetical protein